jgi:hypothetical protein
MGKFNIPKEMNINEETRKLIINKALDVVTWAGKITEAVATRSTIDEKYRNGAWFEGDKILILYESRPPSKEEDRGGLSVMIYYKGNLVFHENGTGLKTFISGPGWKEALWQLHKDVFKEKS